MEVEDFTCGKCGKTFNHKRGLYRHVCIHKAVKRECTFCMKKYASLPSLKIHMITKHSNDQEQTFECSKCELKFANDLTLRQHVNRHEKITKLVPCPICNKELGQGNLRTHLLIHTKEKPFQCVQCKLAFAHRFQLTRHARDHSIAKTPLFCSKCDKKFKTKSEAVRHMRMHSVGERYKCKVCESTFNNVFDLQKHVGTHSYNGTPGEHIESGHNNEVQRHLEDESSALANVSNVEKHIDAHSIEETYSCDICKATFPNMVAFDKHIGTHKEEEYIGIHEEERIGTHREEEDIGTRSIEETYNCDICKATFVNMVDFDKHIGTHNEEEHIGIHEEHIGTREEDKYIRTHVKEHIDTHAEEHIGIHKEEKHIRTYVKEHIETRKEEHVGTCKEKEHKETHVNAKPLQCYVCSTIFSNVFDFKTHMVTHLEQKRFQCEVCKRMFLKNSGLQTHLKVHSLKKTRKTNKMLECPLCNLSFPFQSYLSLHMRLHTGEKPYQCAVCKEKFTYSSKLTQHMRSHNSMNVSQITNAKMC